MPHIIAEYSANLEDHADIKWLLEVIHRVASKTEIFPLAGIRVRAAKRKHYIIADGNPENCFLHVMLYIGTGRSAEEKKAACDRLFQAICDHLSEVFDEVPLAISMTLTELNPDLTYRHNNLHTRLAKD